MIVLDFPPSILAGHANGNSHWQKSSATKKWRAHAKDRTDQVSMPPLADGDIKLHISFFPPDNRGDRVNYPNRLKPLIDGIADALGVNDKRFLPAYYFCPIDRENPRIEVRVAQ